MPNRSYSQLQSYARCPKQYEYGYVKKIPQGPVDASQSFGISVHSTLARWGAGEMEGGTLEVVKQTKDDQLKLFVEEKAPKEKRTMPLILAQLRDLWHKAFIFEGYPTREEALEARQRGEVLMNKWFEWWQSEERTVISVESGFKVELNEDCVVTGRFDRVEERKGELWVVDWKTSRVRSDEEVNEDLQLSVYALACQAMFDRPCGGLSLVFMNDEGVTEVTTKRTQLQLGEAKETIRQYDQAIVQELFGATPTKSVCKGCAYRNICDDAV